MADASGVGIKLFADAIGSAPVAALGGVVGWYLTRLYQRRKDEDSAYRDLDKSYLDLYASALQTPFVLDPDVTYHFDTLDRPRRLQYEAYAYRVWVICETVYDALGLAHEPSGLTAARVYLPTRLKWSGKTDRQKEERPFALELRRNAFIAASQLSAPDWKTWRSVLDIEARLHVKWFIAEGRYLESFKGSFKLGVLRRYGGKLEELEAAAKARYKPLYAERVITGLDAVLDQMKTPPPEMPNAATDTQVKKQIERWWSRSRPAGDGRAPEAR